MLVVFFYFINKQIEFETTTNISYVLPVNIFKHLTANNIYIYMIHIKKIINPDVKNTEYLGYCRLEWAVYMNQFL